MTQTPSPRPAALITGAAVRLGRHLALALADDGYDIALHYNRSSDAAEATAADIRSRGVDCHLVPFDLTQARELATWFGAVCDRLPNLQLLVNSASAYGADPILDTSVDAFDLHLAVNLRAPFFLTQAFAKRCGSGQVIQIIDNKVSFHQHAYASYLLAKKALAEFIPMAAIELGPHIRVNGISPGIVMPSSARGPAYLDWRNEGIPTRTPGSPADIVRALRFLIQSPFVNGQLLTIDGGEGINSVGRHTENFPGGDATR